MNEIIEINGYCIEQNEIDEIILEIIKLFSKKNITHAIAYMILDEVKNGLQNTVIKTND